MAAQQSLPSNRYHNYRHDSLSSDFVALFDENGTALYENEGGGLLDKIIKLNDVSALNQYVIRNPRSLNKAVPQYCDAFWIAACYGNPDTLRILLEHYAALPKPSEAEDPNARGFLLLNSACRFFNVDTARFLLDSQPVEPVYGNIYAREDKWAREDVGETALLSVASALVHCSRFDEIGENDENKARGYMRDHVARCEELMQLLLDRGACASDAVIEWIESPQPSDTVLSLAISRASPGMLKRLIAEGADVHGKTRKYSQEVGEARDGIILDVTPLHIGSFYLNVKGIQILFDHRGSSVEISDMVLCRDSSGCLPLHWAAKGQDGSVSQAIDTIELLLTSNPSTINIRDKQGETALHYAVKAMIAPSHEPGQEGDYAVARAIVELLLQNGADATLRGRKGQTVLHCLPFRKVGRDEPFDTDLVALLLAHGASVEDVDDDGNTALHYAASNLQYIEVVRFLPSRGADFKAKNLKGNTPLHEAAGGYMLFGVSRPTTMDDRVRAQDEMMRVLLDAGGSDVHLMDRPNAAGNTPRQIRDEFRNKWQESEDFLRMVRSGRGRGRGRGRGTGTGTRV